MARTERDGKAMVVANEAKVNPNLVVDAALAIWQQRNEDFNSGKVSKLQQGSFSIRTEDGEKTWLVRPLKSGLRFYVEDEAMAVEFVTKTEVTVKKPDLPKPAKKPATRKKTGRRSKKTSKK